MVAVNILAHRYMLDEWKGFWRSVGGGEDVLVAEDMDKRAAAALNVRELGTTIIVDREGNVAYRDWGPTAYDTLRSEVQKAL